MLRQLPFQTRVSSLPPSLPGVGWAGIKGRQKSCLQDTHRSGCFCSPGCFLFISEAVPPSPRRTSMQFQFEPIMMIFGVLLLIHFLLDTISITQASQRPIHTFFTIHYYVSYSDQFKVLKRMPGQRRTTTDSFFWGKTTFLLMFIRRQAEQALTR